ncbi:MAG: hypothetical protein V3W28_00170 [Thermoplasmata archaeon]
MSQRGQSSHVSDFDAQQDRWIPLRGRRLFVGTTDPSIKDTIYEGDAWYNGTDFRVWKESTSSWSSIAISRGATVDSPSVADIVVWRAPFACTVTAIKGYQDIGTGSTFNAFRGTLASPVLFLASNAAIGTADSWVDGGTVQNAGVSAGDAIYIRIAAVNGTPNRIAIQIDLDRL